METEKKLSKEEVVSKIFELYEECKKFPEWNITIDNILTAIGDKNVIEFFTSVGDIFLSQQLREVYFNAANIYNICRCKRFREINTI